MKLLACIRSHTLTVAFSGIVLTHCAAAETPQEPKVDSALDVVPTDAFKDSLSDGLSADGMTQADSSGETDVLTQDALLDANSNVDSPDSTADVSTDSSSDSTPGPLADAAPSPGSARIEEVYVDVSLETPTVEFVEVALPPGTPLNSYKIRVVDQNGVIQSKRTYTLGQLGQLVPTNGLWVVGGLEVKDGDGKYVTVNQELSKFSSQDNWDLDGSKGSVQLVFDNGQSVELLDVLAYGGSVPQTSTAPVTTMKGTAAALPQSKWQSIGRKAGSNTGNNATDFCVQKATPTKANGACL